MKKVTAIIKPFRLEEVREALAQVGINGLTIGEVHGFGRQKGHSELYRGAEYEIDYVPKLRLEIEISDDLLDRVCEAIITAARTGKVGDGKIFVADVEKAIRIRTGEKGLDALQGPKREGAVAGVEQNYPKKQDSQRDQNGI